MSNWLQLDSSRFNRPEPREIRGVRINVLVSPYDIPQAVRGEFDENLERFVIQFLYPGEEPWKRVNQNEIVSLRVGKNSDRLLGIEVDVHALKADSVELRMDIAQAITDAIDEFTAQRAPGRRKGSYEIAKHVISNESSRILQEITN